MSVINIDKIKLTNFDKNNEEHIRLYDELTSGNSKSNMIHQISERLISSREVENLEFDNAYVIYINDTIMGYLYLTGKRTNYIYIEMSIVKDMRARHLGTYLLDAITNYIFVNNQDLKEVRANIDMSNYVSMKMAENAGFDYDENDYSGQKIDFKKTNPYYVGRRR